MDNTSIPNYVLKDHGLFIDVADFYQRVQATRNRKTLISSLGIRLGSVSINQHIQRIRKEEVIR
jgi:hypothetical protein